MIKSYIDMEIFNFRHNIHDNNLDCPCDSIFIVVVVKKFIFFTLHSIISIFSFRFNIFFLLRFFFLLLFEINYFLLLHKLIHIFPSHVIALNFMLLHTNTSSTINLVERPKQKFKMHFKLMEIV